ncbi:serine hydrolase domain-containing protein [Streptomyces hilarionis]|uniref:serine hydrolase domain-containing protein n=1 Tax=Streptomyces hilarionis TaxID=2839954 RepID=UPI00211A9776|nr:serine hydrolase domain-containing protein [Streptomyces hilarionis]MCQ9130370.1 beta-lactamase family protein [Streptomyces hilarionis]
MSAHPPSHATASALPLSPPSAEGVDALGVLAFLDALEATEAVEPHSLMILRHGRLVASGWWAPYACDRLHLLYSLSKSFTSTALGFAVAEGLIGLDDPVVSYFPEFEAEITDPRSRAMLVRHVASMASGHEEETLDRARALDRDDLVRGFLLLPPEREPGSVFAYNQPATYTLAAIVQRVTGQSLTAYLRPRLLDPLGIGEVAWLTDRTGRELGFSGLHGTTDTVARLGQFYLDRGAWQGKRLLSEEWVAEATRVHVPTAPGLPADADPLDWERGYGFQFWGSRHGYRGDGAYGQFCLVLPEHDAVIVTTAATADMQALLALVWEHLVPAFAPGPLSGREEADTALAGRLTRLALAPEAGEPEPPRGADGWAGAVFAPADGVCADQPGLTAVTVAHGADGWTLRLAEQQDELTLGLPAAGGWRVSDEPAPIAVGGGWTDAGTLTAHLVFLETPHRLRVTCSLATRTFTAHWNLTPLHRGALASMRAPRRSPRSGG